jgi:hypothetical protein
MLWTFKCYLNAKSVDLFDNWYCGLSDQAQAKLDVIVEHFRDKPHIKWGGNYFFPLSGYPGIFEIKFRVANVLYRPLGCFGPDRMEFTFLIGANEQGDEFVPPNAPVIAVERMEIIKGDRTRTRECNF